MEERGGGGYITLRTRKRAEIPPIRIEVFFPREEGLNEWFRLIRERIISLVISILMFYRYYLTNYFTEVYEYNFPSFRGINGKLPLFHPKNLYPSSLRDFRIKLLVSSLKKKRNNNKRKRKRDSTSRYTHRSSYLITPVSPLLLLLLLSMMEQLTNGEILTEKENGRMVSSFRSQNFANPSLPPSRPRAFKLARFLLALTAADYCFRHASAYIRPRISRGIKTPISLHSLHS